MKKLKSFYNVETDGVTQGLLATWLQCRYKTRHFLRGWSPKSVSMGLTFGSIIHGILQTSYESIRVGSLKHLPSKNQIISYTSSAEKQWRIDNPRSDKKTLENLELALLIAEATLPLYFDYWNKDIKEMQWRKVEHSFRIPYVTRDERKTLLRGKMDGVYGHGKSWLFETKSKSIIVEADLVDILPFEFQINFYLMCLRMLKIGIPQGVLYNIIRRTCLRRGKNETLVQFAKRCVEDIKSRPEFYFIRLEIKISKKELDIFKEELNDMVQDFMNWWGGKSGHYRNTGQCITKYGRCSSLPICANDSYTYHSKRKKVFRELEDF